MLIFFPLSLFFENRKVYIYHYVIDVLTQKVRTTEKRFPAIVTTREIYDKLFLLKSEFDVYSFSEVFEHLIEEHKRLKNE